MQKQSPQSSNMRVSGASSGGPPSAWKLERVVSLAQATLERLRTEDGLVIETGAEVLAALEEEDVDAEGLLRQAVRAALDAKANKDVAALRMADLKARVERFERQEEGWRRTVLEILQALELPGYFDPEFTLSISKGTARRVIITDDTELPGDVVKVTEVRTPDKTAIKAKLLANEAVPGAALSNTMPSLIIRTK